MKKLGLILLLFVLACSAEAQKKTVKKAPAKKTAKGKKSNTKKKKTTSGEGVLDELICYEGGPCTFNIHKGDTLVYAVNNSGQQYNFLVIPNKFDVTSGADFNWVMTEPINRKGRVTISSAGLKSGKKLVNYFSGGDLKLTDASAVWLSTDNFKDITSGETKISMDNAAPETFSSPETDAVTPTINYKGKEITLDGFAIESKPGGNAARKELWVLNITNNLLIIKMDLGWTIELKEIREKK
jgi:hypothetical protein